MTVTDMRREDVVGKVVRCRLRRLGVGDYQSSAIERRVMCDGRTGQVVQFSAGHGLCYEVRFYTSPTFDMLHAWFDPEELEVIE